MNQETTADVYRRFYEVYGEEPVTHPLYQEMLSDIRSGRRTKASVLADIEEAASHKKRSAEIAPGWGNKTLSI